MFTVDAISKGPLPYGTFDDSCEAVYGGIVPNPLRKGWQSQVDRINKETREMRKGRALSTEGKGALNTEGKAAEAQGYRQSSRHPRYSDDSPAFYLQPDPSARDQLYRGVAVILSGPITSVTNTKHQTNLKQGGLFENVPIFIGGPFNGVPSPGQPIVTANSYKIVFNTDEY